MQGSSSGSSRGLPPSSPKPTFSSPHKGVLAVPHRFEGYARIAGVARNAGDAEMADLTLRWARVLSPDEPRLLVNVANLWLSTGLKGDPVRALYRALCLDPGFIPAANRLVLLRKAIGDKEGAIRIAGWGLCRGSGSRVDAILELALLVFESGDRHRSHMLARAALMEIVRSGADPRPLCRLVDRIGGSEFLIQVLRVLLCVSPTDETAALELASAPVEDRSQWSTRAILPLLSRALPMHSVVHNGAGVFLEHQGRAAEALNHYTKATVLDPALSISIFNLGVQARYAGHFDRARRLFERALALGPTDPIYRYNLGHVLLANGDPERGLELYEERWRSGQRQSHRRGGPEPSFPQPIWNGPEAMGAEPGPEASVLIWGEQGLGDEIWFAGYAPRLFEGGNTVLECDERLAALFRRSNLAKVIVPRCDPPRLEARRAARQIAAGSLPLLERQRPLKSGLPAHAPRGYLKVAPSRAEALRARLATLSNGPTIGISWRSSKPNPARSFEAPLDLWGPILGMSGVTFVNLQYDSDHRDLAQIRTKFGVHLVMFDDIDPLNDIDDLAALISVLDHVVSIANVNVPLCHGIGRDCHVALRHYQEDWRFQRNRDESPWLPDCRFYWPPRDGDWESVFLQIRARLIEEIRDGPSAKGIN
jgi:Flp pilus assembly protein TadD